jgi:hypothetical protein
MLIEELERAIGKTAIIDRRPRSPATSSGRTRT